MAYPDPPEEMLGPMEDHEVSQLWTDLVQELMDQKFAGRTHGNRRTYDIGCQGPLCRKATRERARQRQKTGVSEKYRYIDMLLEFWAPLAASRIRRAQLALTRELIGE